MQVAFDRRDLDKLSQLVEELPEGDEDNLALGQQMMDELGHRR